MNTYLIQLLQLLLNHSGNVKIEEALDYLKLKRRMLIYYLRQLNEFLKDKNLSIINMDDEYLSLDIKESNQINEFLDSIQFSEYQFDNYERQQCIILEIGLSQKPVFLENLIEQFKVSKQTLLNDMNSIKSTLSEFNILLKNKQKKGYYFIGDELMIRYVLLSSYHQKENSVIDRLKKSLILTEFSEQFSHEKEQDILYKIEQILEKNENTSGNKFIYFSLKDLAQTILLVTLRSKKQEINLLDVGSDDVAYELNSFALVELSNILQVSEKELVYLCLVLQSAKVIYLDPKEYESVVIDLARSLLMEFKKVSRLNILDNNELFEMFLLHVHSMYYRLKYKIKITDFKEQIPEEKQAFFYITKKVMQQVCSEYGIIDDDEVQYLSFYFSCMEKQSREKENINYNKRDKILVVCAAGLGSSVYIKYQLSKLVKDYFEITISNLRNYEEMLDERTKLIISTVQIDSNCDLNIPIMNISTVLSNQNKHDIVEWLLQSDDFFKNNGTLSTIIDIIQNYTIIKNQKMLLYELNAIFNPEIEADKGLNLRDIFKLKDVRIFDNADTWQDGIMKAGNSIVETGIIKQDYLKDIISTLDKYGPYCECLPGILVAHAEPSSNVEEPTISLGVFKEPIYVDKWKKEIIAIFILGVVDTTSHANAFAQLINNCTKNNIWKSINKYNNSLDLYKDLVIAKD